MYIKKQSTQMEHWVYIYKYEGDDLKIALSSNIDSILNLKPKGKVVYLRPFEFPFDALAHKHLLEDLSKESVLCWIKKHHKDTDVWLHVT